MNQSIYHIHGCITKPASIIITLNDYYKFQNVNNYFSRKFYTLLQESTVAILGYSLGDFNLNTILSEVKNSKKESFRKSDIFFISQRRIPEIMKSFYDTTYGISVIEKTEVDDFFDEIDSEYERAVEIIGSTEQLQKFLIGQYKYEDDFIKLKICMTWIFILASSLGLNKDNTTFLHKLLEILDRKVRLCKEPHAWAQYSHLANWLIDISSTIIIKDSPIEKGFCEIVNFSVSTSSSTNTPGYSWEAWKIWKRRFNEIKWDNQVLLIDCIKDYRPSLHLSLVTIKKATL